MDRFHLYHGSLMLVGAVLAVNALSSVMSIGLSVSNTLLAIGGSGMGLASIHAIFTTEPTAVTINRYHFRLVVLGALLTIGGTVLQVLG